MPPQELIEKQRANPAYKHNEVILIGRGNVALYPGKKPSQGVKVTEITGFSGWPGEVESWPAEAKSLSSARNEKNNTP